MIQRPAHPVRNVVDSSAWLAYFTNEPNAAVFAPAIEATAGLVVPTISITEVFRWVLRERGESDALQITAVVELDAHLAVSAAHEGLRHKLPLADSILLATARSYNAVLWPQDVDFEGIPNVEYHPKPKRS
jgi:predicted nucleic acid-binding protein